MINNLVRVDELTFETLTRKLNAEFREQIPNPRWDVWQWRCENTNDIIAQGLWHKRRDTTVFVVDKTLLGQK